MKTGFDKDEVKFINMCLDIRGFSNYKFTDCLKIKKSFFGAVFWVRFRISSDITINKIDSRFGIIWDREVLKNGSTIKYGIAGARTDESMANLIKTVLEYENKRENFR
ncbi:hypothetical protein [Sphingobacterium sp.]|uniref:hypothetical protein n=1 Tax=Sphingobacterium sp. TaxID=341027 RepID=UPI0028A2743D|nr:hypothetical protein [Sphingobacterium sp.]